MTTVDQFLTHLVTTDALNTIDLKDRRILVSLAKQVSSKVFLTENQCNLLLKILRTYNLHNVYPALATPTWSQAFREVEQMRKMYINEESQELVIEFTHNTRIRQILSDLAPSLDNSLRSDGPKKYFVDLTERNIYSVIRELKNFSFEIDAKLREYYQEISGIIKTGSIAFNFSELEQDSAIMRHLVAEVPINNVTVADRRIRFQYQYPAVSGPVSTLTEKIATRPARKIYVNSRVSSLTEVLQSLAELNRLPVLFIMDQHSADEANATLAEIYKAIEPLAGTTAGIYYRFESKSPAGNMFNTAVKELGLNSNLTKETTFAGISNNQLPKFFFKSEWYPQSVISFVNTFKNNKTSAFCDEVDLIIYHNAHRPVSTDIYEIV